MIPIKTSIAPRRTPYANYLIIAANVVVFILSYHWQSLTKAQMQPWVRPFLLTPEYLALWQFVTYAFLHSGWMHIIGNMYFLYMFGNNVNDRLGNVGYLCFYLAGAVFSGIGHVMFSNTPVLGASGAVAAVTGAYMVLFPNTLITIIYPLFYFWHIGEIRALYFIVFKLVVWDNILEPKISPQPIAYGAHLGGYGFGVICIMLLLVFGIIEAGYNSLWAIMKQWNRRRVFRGTVSNGYDPFGAGAPRKPVEAQIKNDFDELEKSEIANLREQISEALSRKNMPEAAKFYKILLEADPKQVLSRQNQLDVANTLMSDSQWTPAAKAYENFLTQYGQNEYAEQVQLMLGLLYTRYIPKLDKAEELLKQAREKLTQPNQIRMCDDLLAEIDHLS